jgi:formyltetrahydrofolate synthetase
LQYEDQQLSPQDLEIRLKYLQSKYEKDLKQLQMEFQKTFEPLNKLYKKKKELQEVDEQLKKEGYEETEVEMTPKSKNGFPHFRSNISNNYESFPSKQSKKKKSFSPMKIISKTGNDFYSQAGGYKIKVNK